MSSLLVSGSLVVDVGGERAQVTGDGASIVVTTDAPVTVLAEALRARRMVGLPMRTRSPVGVILEGPKGNIARIRPDRGLLGIGVRRPGTLLRAWWASRRR